ncbi:Bacterial protein of uncharacterised function (DUF945) [Kingella potus]|uniref:Bacterial protein of uncharacterized function (DUF945) n=1 Tax=Kingella potus TaxID=265175 RepID=A0A377R0U2_9NEIS|nr:DUF945 family protein [Kingella potus]UOP00941.1 YdgA family protein [Kingella potus]STR00600.1 Bacterial protein of uncharacterised function (DUF945) [Kingella potus]
MNKKTLIAGAAGIALAGMVGGNIAADKKLESAYQNSFNVQDKRFKANVSAFNMGAMSGSAKWTGELTADLCSPETKYSFRSEDTIKRGLGGYNVVSKIYVKNPDSGQETYLFDINSRTTWGGSINSEIVVPANSISEKQSTFAWEQATAAFTLKKEQDGMHISDIKVRIPAITLKDPKFNLALKNISYHADTISFSGIAAGKTGGKVESLTFAETKSKPFEISLNNLESEAEVAVKGGKLLYTTSSKLDNVSFQGNKLEQIRYNLSVKDVDAQPFEKLSSVLKEAGQRCVPYSENANAMEEFAKALMQTGGTIESKDNQILFNGSKASAQWEAVIPPNVLQGNMTGEQIQELVKQAKSQGEVRIDKQFVRESYKALAGVTGTPADAGKIEQGVQEFETSILKINESEWKDTVQAKIDGGQWVLTLNKEAGKLPAALDKAAP